MLRLIPERSASSDEKSTTSQAEEARQGSGHQSHELRPILNNCCRQKQPARLHVLHTDTSIEGAFLSLTAREIWVRFLADGDQLDLPLRALCCVSFADQNSHGAFLGLVEDVRYGADGARDVALSMPSQILTTNLRETFRVLVVGEMGLRVVLQTTGGEVFEPKLKNIATTGFQAEFPDDHDPGWPLGTRLLVKLHWQEECLTLAAEVRRRRGSRYGLMFVHEPAADDRQRRETLRRLVQRVQQQWLKVRTF